MSYISFSKNFRLIKSLFLGTFNKKMAPFEGGIVWKI